eukprot:s3276_g7.t1
MTHLYQTKKRWPRATSIACKPHQASQHLSWGLSTGVAHTRQCWERVLSQAERLIKSRAVAIIRHFSTCRSLVLFVNDCS